MTSTPRATPDATRRHRERFPSQRSARLGRSDLHASGVGFGGYRVSTGVTEHRAALERALLGGVNLIDTSANYADGGSELLICEVLGELFESGGVRRDETIIVSKGGYIQGSNLAMARERAESGEGFAETVELSTNLWHSIAPEFLHDQIARSRARLGVHTIDIYLLHNPEYYLTWAERAGLPAEGARKEYHRRLAAAFAHLEREVADGRIAWYGVSSNTLPAPRDADNATDINQLIASAQSLGSDHHFTAVQFPANLVERGFILEPREDGRSLVDSARDAGLGTLANRPLNAIVGEDLVRLADFPAARDVDEERVVKEMEEVKELERQFLFDHLERFADDPETKRALREFVSVGSTMERYRETFGSIEAYNDILSHHFAPRLSFVRQQITAHGDDELIAWYARYIDRARTLLDDVGAGYAMEAQRRSDRLRREIAGVVTDAEGSLSQLAVRLLWGAGVDTVLVGMRREEYVEDSLGALERGALGNEESWKALGSGA